MPGDNSSVAYWEGQLDEINDELSNLVGAGSLNVGSFSVDEKAAYDNLMRQKAHAEDMLNRLGSGDSSTENAIVEGPTADWS